MKSRKEFDTEEEYLKYLRTCFAAMAMPGIISTIKDADIRNAIERLSDKENITIEFAIADMSVKQADALIEALNTPTKQ